jgi:hypothetical protein
MVADSPRVSVKERWGWIELFAAIQILWGALFFLPGVQPYRQYIRAVPYLASLGALVWCMRGPSGERMPAASKWMLAVFAVLAASLLHPSTYLEAGIAQVIFQISIAAPMFWAARMIRTEARLTRLLWIILAASFASALVGVLQVYFPDWFLPPEFSSLAQRMNPAFVDALSYVGADLRPIIRPPGLSDLPGGAALGGLISVVIGVAFVGQTRHRPLARLFSAVAAAVGMTALYLTQVRSLTVMAAVSLLVFALLRLRQGHVRQGGWIVAGSVAMIVASFLWATAIGGKAVEDRFSTLIDTGLFTTFQESRGQFLGYTIRELLFKYPFGAGVGRWGMMQVYFNDPAMWHSPPIYVEIQVTGWLLDGGFLMWLCYGGALASASRLGYLAAVVRSRDSLQYLAAIILSFQFAIIGLCLTGPVFNTQLGVVFWTITGALFGVVSASRSSRRSEWL